MISINTFDKKLADNRNKGRYYIKKTIVVKIEPLSKILKQYLPKETKIDFFTIDVEGLDLEVLYSNDWNMYTPQYILVEDIDFDFNEPVKSEVYNFLSQKGYKLISILKRTIIYKKT